MSDLKLILGLVKAYNLKVKNHIKAVKDEDNEAASRLFDGVFDDRIRIYDRLIEETIIVLPDSAIIETLRSIRDGNSDQWLEFAKLVEEKDSEHIEMFNKEHPGVAEKFMEWVVDLDTKENPLSAEEAKLYKEHMASLSSQHVPAEEELDKNEYARKKATDDIVGLYNELDLYRYWERSLEVGPILLIEKTATPNVSFFAEIRRCYSLGNYSASVALCRAFLEEVLKNYYKQQLDVTSNKKIKDLWKGDFNNLIDDEELKLNDTLKDWLHSVRLCAKEVLHRGKCVEREEALKHLRNTRSVIEELYA